jgi:hypothetical protein
MNEDEVVEEERTPGLVLTGFGSYRLQDMLEWIGTDKEDDLLSAFTKWPPVYREERICDEQDLEYACQYLAFIQDSILEYELNTPEGDEENTDGND